MESYEVALFLSRLQFAFTISFHILFPAFTIGLASYLAVLEGLYLFTKKKVFLSLYKFWIKIFALSFAFGVVSGIVMSYQFGTNWSELTYKAGNILGPLLGYEVLTAFFLEASFLGIMLFGMNKVGPKLHFASTIIVALGTLISAFWILSANSWMQTPQGFIIDSDGIFQPTSWFEIVFNPSFIARFPHMVIACYLTTAFVVMGVGAHYLLQKKFINESRLMIAKALFLIVILAPTQVFIGDMQGLNSLEHQPLKVAAMEGIWEDEKGAALRVFGWPDEEAEETKYSIEIPYLSGLILTHSFDGEVKGLKSWDKNDRPPVPIIFFAFRIMVGIGLLMLLTAFVGSYLVITKKLVKSKWFLKWCRLMIPSGFIAILSGWIVTEVGRQPFVIYGFLRTSKAASPSIESFQVALSLGAFMTVYTIIFGAGAYYMLQLIKKGPSYVKNEEYFNEHTMSEIKPILNSWRDK